MTADLDPRQHAFRADLADARLCGRVEAERYVDPEPACVVATTAPMHARPEPGPLTSELLAGERVAVYERRNGWAWVQNEADGYVGYLDERALAPVVSATATHRVTARQTHVYPTASVKGTPVRALSFGSHLALTGRNKDNFAEIVGHRWVYRPHVAPLSEAEPDYTATARRLLGAPYLWGGRSAFGLDCSALVQLVLAAAGIACPRDSDQQKAALPSQTDGPPRRGDIVFFPGHVGIMVDNARLLHANASHMAVTIDPVGWVAGLTRAESGVGIIAIARPV